MSGGESVGCSEMHECCQEIHHHAEIKYLSLSQLDLETLARILSPDDVVLLVFMGSGLTHGLFAP